MIQGDQVVVTGGTGLVGRQVVRRLLEAGYCPLVWLREDSSVEALSDITGWQRFDPTQAKPVAWMDLAWKGVAGRERDDPDQLWYNLPRMLEHIRLAARRGCRHWIGMGSQAEYGHRIWPIRESELPAPDSLYGQAKLACAYTSAAACTAEGMSYSWLRLFSTYGPGDRHGFIGYLIRELLQGRSPQVTRCEQTWDYLYVGDVADAVVNVLQSRATGIYNLGSGTGVVLREVVETLQKVIGPACPPVQFGAIPYREGQPVFIQSVVDLLTAATGWRPQTTLEEGLRLTVEQEMSKL